MKIPRPTWQEFASCKGRTDVFFPEKGEPSSEAKAICRGCPVREPCLAGAVERGEDQGLWGGAGGQTLRVLRRARGTDEFDALVAEHFAALDEDRPAVIDANGPGATHGIAATYAKGCRCNPCTWAGQARAERESAERRRKRKPKWRTVEVAA